jgi:hypothetical protein
MNTQRDFILVQALRIENLTSSLALLIRGFSLLITIASVEFSLLLL